MAYFSEVFAMAGEHIHFITVASRAGRSVRRMYRTRAGREPTGHRHGLSAKRRSIPVVKAERFDQDVSSTFGDQPNETSNMDSGFLNNTLRF
jgi:hypothetical protein